MSENIQSIANGSFVLGNTNELTFSAGPGIKVDQPREGVVRIGNDETVLYDRQGQYNANLSAVTVSEPLSAFDRVLFYDSKGGVIEKNFPSTDPSTQYIRFSHYSPTICWASVWKVDDTNYLDITGNIGSLTNCSAGVVTGSPTTAGPGSPYNRWLIPMKIIGINRKEV